MATLHSRGFRDVALCIDTFGIDSPVTELPDIPVQQITGALETHERKVSSGEISLDEAFEIAIAIEGSEADAIIYVPALNHEKSD